MRSVLDQIIERNEKNLKELKELKKQTLALLNDKNDVERLNEELKGCEVSLYTLDNYLRTYNYEREQLRDFFDYLADGELYYSNHYEEEKERIIVKVIPRYEESATGEYEVYLAIDDINIL